MFQMPMSSPMITTMFGFGCAAAGEAVSATAVNSATRTSSPFRLFLMAFPPSVSCGSMRQIFWQSPAGDHATLVLPFLVLAMLRHRLSLFLEREDPLPIVLHADHDPALLLRLGHQRVREGADLRLRSVGVLARGVVVVHEHRSAGAWALW